MSFAVVGEALVDLIAGEDGTFRPHLGGSPFNVAIGLARQGVDVSYLSSLSEDRFGDLLHESLSREGVALPLPRRSRCPTSLSLVTVDPRGQPSYRLYRQGVADKDTSFEEIVAGLPDGLSVFHTGSLAITPSQLPKIRKLIELVRARGVPVSMDINVRLQASDDTQEYLRGVRALIGEADIVKASDEDLEALGLAAGARDSAELAFGRMRSGILVLTTGSGGAVVLSRNGTVERRAYRVAKVADTVGAGDTFHSAFLAGLHRSGTLALPVDETPLEVLGDALDFACAAAAINVTRTGCSPPTEAEVREFINQA